MIKNFKWTLVLVLSLFGLTAAGLYQDKLFEISKNLEIFTRIYKELNSGFVDDLDPNILMKTAIDAMVNSLDPYTNYVTESQVESYRTVSYTHLFQSKCYAALPYLTFCKFNI